MALARRKSGTIHSKTGADLEELKSKYDNSKHNELTIFEGEAALIYQIQLLKEDIDELRRYIASNEIATEIDCSRLPTTRPRTSGLLYNDRGIIKVS
tara:strand:+ start:1044 stop:1334 length:291 start_codon:yes stop_codon:yes gene_type:complete